MKRKASIIPESLRRILHDKNQFPWSPDKLIVRELLRHTLLEGFLDLASLSYVTLSLRTHCLLATFMLDLNSLSL